MAIQEIVIKNMKGTIENQLLTGKDIIVGRNGIGKSTRIQALGAALLGYVPGQGKTPAETFKLSSDFESMTVGLKTDSFTFQREFTRKERKKQSTGEKEVKYSEAVTLSPSKGERTNTQKKSRIEQEVGNFPVMLDFSQFLSLSDNKRRDFIYSLSSQESGWNKQRLQDYLERELLDMEIEINNPDYYEVLKETISKALEQFPNGFEFSDGLNAVISWASDQLKHYRKLKGDTEGAVRSFAEMKNKMAETDRNAKQNKQELKDLREKLTEVKEQLAQDTEKKKAYDKRIRKISELESRLQQLQTAPIASIEPIVEKIASLHSQKIDLPESKASDYQAKSLELKRKADQIQALAGSNKEQIAEYKAKRAAIQETVDTIINNKGVCVIQKQIACNKDFSSYLNHATESIEAMTIHIERLGEKVSELQQQLNNCYKEQREWEQKAQEDNNAFRKAVNHNQQIDKHIQELEAKKRSIEKQNEEREQNIKHIKDEIEQLKSEKVEAMAPLDILEQQRDRLVEQIAELEMKVEQQDKVKNQLLTLRQSMLENKKAEMNTEAYSSIQKALGPQGVQGAIVKEQLDPIKRDIEANLKAMGIEHEVFFQTTGDTGQEVFRFGWIDGEARNFDSLSTGQQIIYLIAFMVTILERANPKLKVLAIDNIENLDRNNFENVLRGLDKLSTKLDNIILAGVIESFEVEGWKVWNLSANKEAIA